MRGFRLSFLRGPGVNYEFHIHRGIASQVCVVFLPMWKLVVNLKCRCKRLKSASRGLSPRCSARDAIKSTTLRRLLFPFNIRNIVQTHNDIGVCDINLICIFVLSFIDIVVLPTCCTSMLIGRESLWNTFVFIRRHHINYNLLLFGYGVIQYLQ